MDLNAINTFTSGAGAYTSKPLKKLTELPVGEPFDIINMKIVKGKFGDAPLVETLKFVTFLPARSTTIIQSNMENFKPSTYKLIYTGVKSDTKYKPFATFQIV